MCGHAVSGFCQEPEIKQTTSFLLLKIVDEDTAGATSAFVGAVAPASPNAGEFPANSRPPMALSQDGTGRARRDGWCYPNFRWVLLACRRPGSGRAGAAELLLDDGLALVGLAALVRVFVGNNGYNTSGRRCRRAVHLHGGLLPELQLLAFWVRNQGYQTAPF